MIQSLIRRVMRDAPPPINTFGAEAPLATFPLLVVLLVLAGFVIAQRWIDHGDPKLASNAKPEPRLPFT